MTLDDDDDIIRALRVHLRSRPAQLELVRVRVKQGREQYGPFRLIDDTRDFPGEAIEELIDGIVYIAAHEQRLKWRDSSTVLTRRTIAKLSDAIDDLQKLRGA